MGDAGGGGNAAAQEELAATLAALRRDLEEQKQKSAAQARELEALKQKEARKSAMSETPAIVLTAGDKTLPGQYQFNLSALGHGYSAFDRLDQLLPVGYAEPTITVDVAALALVLTDCTSFVRALELRSAYLQAAARGGPAVAEEYWQQAKGSILVPADVFTSKKHPFSEVVEKWYSAAVQRCSGAGRNAGADVGLSAGAGVGPAGAGAAEASQAMLFPTAASPAGVDRRAPRFQSAPPPPPQQQSYGAGYRHQPYPSQQYQPQQPRGGPR